MSVATHYDTLKVSRDAPPEVIQAAYKSLAQKYHPDRNLDNPEAVSMMQMINTAYRILSDARHRSDHDAWIKQQDPPKAPPPLTPKEQELKKKSDETAAEAKKWSDWAAKVVAEASAARAKATKVAEQLKNAQPTQRTAFEAMFAREDSIAKVEEAKASDAMKKAQDTADIAMRHAFSKDGKGLVTHYDTLKVAYDAPMEVIQAAARALSMKLQAAEQATRLLAVNNAFSFLTDPTKKAEHDAWIRLQLPKEQAADQTARKPTARELEAKAKADRTEIEAKALEASADQAMRQEREAVAKAADALKTAQAKAKEKDGDKWKAYADKLTLEASQEKTRAAKAAAKAAEARLKAQQTQKEAEDAKIVADREAAMWDKGTR